MTGHANGHAASRRLAERFGYDPSLVEPWDLREKSAALGGCVVCGRGQSDRPMTRRGSEFCSERCEKAATT